jgi:hypothetical protein
MISAQLISFEIDINSKPSRPMTLLQKIDIVHVSSEVIQGTPICEPEGVR